MSSIRIKTRKDGSSYTQILFRETVDGRRVQTSESFDDHIAALRFKKILDASGPDTARSIFDAERLDSRAAPVVTLNANFAETYIRGLTGLSDAQRDRYRAYMRNDFKDYLGDLPLEALCASSAEKNSIVQDWVNDEESDGAAGKTIANKHGFLSAMLKVAVRRRLMPFNPCDDTSLPPRNYEPTFLEPSEFDILLDMVPERWQALTFFLASTGVRFSEATALRVGDLKCAPGPAGEDDEWTARVSRAWKYTGTAVSTLGGPKTRKGVRTINVAGEAVEYLNLNRPAGKLLFATEDGREARISSQLFHNRCWRPIIESFERKTGKKPRPHDLRHTCASWMINNGAELTDVQGHLGHEKITTTVDIYGHLDRRSGSRAAAAVSRALGKR